MFRVVIENHNHTRSRGGTRVVADFQDRLRDFHGSQRLILGALSKCSPENEGFFGMISQSVTSRNQPVTNCNRLNDYDASLIALKIFASSL